MRVISKQKQADLSDFVPSKRLKSPFLNFLNRRSHVLVRINSVNGICGISGIVMFSKLTKHQMSIIIWNLSTLNAHVFN